MIMKVSSYEITLPLVGKDEKEIEDYRLMVNGLYGAYDIVAKEDCEKISAGKFDELPLALLEKLLLRGHLTRKSEAEELADMKLLARLNKKIYGGYSIGLIIMPTYDCNFRCPYCFEQHRLNKGKDWLSQTMSDEMIEAVFAALKNYKDRGYDVDHCTFYGGEPLLAKNLPVVRKIAEHCRELDLEMGAITNSYDLEAYREFFEEFKFKSLQITVDGMGEVNDRRRVHKEGVGTYERILANVELALELGIRVSLRVNIGFENIHGIKDLIEDLKARGFIDKENERAAEEKALRETAPKVKTKRGMFSYYFKAATNDFKHEKAVLREKDVLDELIKIGFTTKEAIDRESQYSVARNLKALFQKKNFPSFVPTFCGAERSMMVIDPFGKIFACWDFVGIDDKVVGFTDVRTGRFLWGFDKAKWKTRTVDIMEKCKTCPYCFICRGGCASRAEYNTGNCFREDCAESKEIFNFVASLLAGAHWQEHHEEELSLSLADPLSRLTQKERETIMTTKSQKELFELAKNTGLMPEEVQEK